MAIRSFLAASIISLSLSSAFAEQPLPLPDHGKNSEGQEWTVTFDPGGVLSAVSTCKAEARTAYPYCRYYGSGTWRRNAAGRLCYTITQWQHNTAYGLPEKCI
jgi:hypothetical protein